MTAMKTVQRVLVAGGTGGTGRLAVGRLRSLGIPTRIPTRDRRHAASGGYRGVLTRQWKPTPRRDEAKLPHLGELQWGSPRRGSEIRSRICPRCRIDGQRVDFAYASYTNNPGT